MRSVLSHNLGPTSYQIVLEIHTGPPVWGRQLWRRTGNFLLIFLQSNVYDLRFKPWGPTTFWLSFQQLHPMDSYHLMSIHPLIPMIELFLNLTFKIQGQSHSSRSHNRNNILSTHIPFIPCWSALPFLRCSYLKNWPCKSKVKGEVKVQSQSESNILSPHIPLVPCQSALPFSRYNVFKIWPWKSKVKVIAQGHKVSITPYRLNSFCSMSIDPAIPGIQQFENLTLKIQGPGHAWGQSWKS